MASMGSALGLLLSLWGTRLVVGLVAGTGQRLALRLQPDLVVLLFTAGAAVVTGLIFGLAPALRATKSAALASLVERGRTVIAAGRRWSARDSFIAVQIGLSLVLVACGTMFVRTVRNLEMQDIGSRPERLLLASIVPDRGHRPELSVLVPRLVERVRALPGVESASVAAFGTLANQGGIYGIEVDGFTPTDQQDTRARVDYVGPDYLRTAGIPLVAGREFAWTDAGDSMPVAVVNETMARFYFGDVRAVGRRFRFNKTEFAIVGVARDAKYSELRETAPPRYVYFSALQRAPGVRSLEIRVSSGAAPTLAALRALVRDVDPRLMIPAVMPMSERISLKGGVERMVAALVAFFAVVTLLLAAIGIYGTIAYNAARRTKEIGLRLALGASRAGVIWLLIGAVGVQLAVGVVAGVAAVALGGRLVASLLFGVGPTDPLTIGMPVALLAAVALVAGSIPALRAARLDPARVLRE
jgi:predicted permease